MGFVSQFQVWEGIAAVFAMAGALLFPGSSWLEAGTAVRKIRMHVDDAKLAVVVFAVGGHHPEEIDRASGRWDIWVIALWHQHHVAFADNHGKLGRRVVGVDQL